MAKKSMIAREVKRTKCVEKHAKKRAELKEIVRTGSPKARYIAQRQLQQLPANASPIRQHNRCGMTGRPHGYYRKIGLGRNKFRELAMQGLIPGIVKASW